jgi:hypothetical protein
MEDVLEFAGLIGMIFIGVLLLLRYQSIKEKHETKDHS